MKLLERIDEELLKCAHRRTYNATEMMNVLLDIRSIAVQMEKEWGVLMDLSILAKPPKNTRA